MNEIAYADIKTARSIFFVIIDPTVTHSPRDHRVYGDRDAPAVTNEPAYY